MSTRETNVDRLRAALGCEKPSNAAELLANILPLLKIIVRVATAPEVKRALTYNDKAREAVADFYVAVNAAATAAHQVITALGSEDGGEFLARPVQRVTLSRCA